MCRHVDRANLQFHLVQKTEQLASANPARTERMTVILSLIVARQIAQSSSCIVMISLHPSFDSQDKMQ
jgi:hypothetical protein